MFVYINKVINKTKKKIIIIKKENRKIDKRKKVDEEKELNIVKNILVLAFLINKQKWIKINLNNKIKRENELADNINLLKQIWVKFDYVITFTFIQFK